MNYYCTLNFPRVAEKVNTIKALRTATGMGLRESKDLVEATAHGDVRLLVNADQLLRLTSVVTLKMTVYRNGEESKAPLWHYLHIEGVEPAAPQAKNISDCTPHF